MANTDPVARAVTRAAIRLLKAMDDGGHEHFMLIDSFVGEKPHAVVVVVNTPEKAAKLLKQIKYKPKKAKKGGGK